MKNWDNLLDSTDKYLVISAEVYDVNANHIHSSSSPNSEIRFINDDIFLEHRYSGKIDIYKIIDNSSVLLKSYDNHCWKLMQSTRCINTLTPFCVAYRCVSGSKYNYMVLDQNGDIKFEFNTNENCHVSIYHDLLFYREYKPNIGTRGSSTYNRLVDISNNTILINVPFSLQPCKIDSNYRYVSINFRNRTSSLLDVETKTIINTPFDKLSSINIHPDDKITSITAVYNNGKYKKKKIQAFIDNNLNILFESDIAKNIKERYSFIGDYISASHGKVYKLNDVIAGDYSMWFNNKRYAIAAIYDNRYAVFTSKFYSKSFDFVDLKSKTKIISRKTSTHSWFKNSFISEDLRYKRYDNIEQPHISSYIKHTGIFHTIANCKSYYGRGLDTCFCFTIDGTVVESDNNSVYNHVSKLFYTDVEDKIIAVDQNGCEVGSIDTGLRHYQYSVAGYMEDKILIRADSSTKPHHVIYIVNHDLSDVKEINIEGTLY